MSELGAARFALRQQSDGITVDEEQVPQVEGDDTCFRFEERTKHLHIVRDESAAYLQDHDTVFSHQSVDSAGHVHLSGQHTPTGKRSAIADAVKTTENQQAR
jgi:hypothetical protein